jgi:hypothetical protein
MCFLLFLCPVACGLSPARAQNAPASVQQIFNRIYLPSSIALYANPGSNPNVLNCVSNPITLTTEAILNCVYDRTNKALFISLVSPWPPPYTVATLPSSPVTNQVVVVTDLQSAGTCTPGGGSTRGLCLWNGAAWVSVGGGGGGAGNPGGSSGQIEYNNAGAFGGFTMAGDCALTVPNITCTKTSGTAFGSLATSSGPLASTLASASHKWLNSYTASTGAFTQTQPLFTDISGTLASSQCPAATNTTAGCVTGSQSLLNETGSYAVQSTDNGALIVMNCSSACAVTLPASPPTSPWVVDVESIGSTLATVSLNGNNFNGGSSAPTLVTDTVAFFASSGSGYYGQGQSLAGTGLSATPGAANLTYSLSTPVAIANGGTGQTTASAAFNALSPLTTLGDLVYENATPAAARLAGNTSATKNFLTQTGTGSASAAPAWGTIAATDIPAALSNTTSVNGVTIPTAAGSATATQTIASGSAAMGTSAISSGTCASAVTVSATGVSAALSNPTGTPTGTAGSSGSMSAGTYYMKVVAVDGAGKSTAPGTESAGVTTSGSTGSIAWSWTAVSNAASYQVWLGTSSGGEANYFTSSTNSYTETANPSSGTSGTIPSSNTSIGDVISATPNTDPTAISGYGPSSSGSLYIQAYPTLNNVNFKVCNNTSSSITPASALTLNWRVSR